MQNNDIGLRSQELTEQSAGRRQQAIMAQAQTWATLPSVVQEYMQAHANAQQQGIDLQKHQMEMMLGTSKLADDQLQRQQAAEELQWTQALHQTDMLGYQKEVAKAHASLLIAQARKAQDDLTPHMQPRDINEADMDYVIGELGYTMDPGTGKLIDATEDQRKAARERSAHRESIVGQRQLAVAQAQAQARAALEQSRARTQVSVAEIRAEAIKAAAELRAQGQANSPAKATARIRILESEASVLKEMQKENDPAKKKQIESVLNEIKALRQEVMPGATGAASTPEDKAAQIQRAMQGLGEFFGLHKPTQEFIGPPAPQENK